MVLVLIFRPLSHSELIFVYKVKVLFHSFAYGYSDFPAFFIEKTICFPWKHIGTICTFATFSIISNSFHFFPEDLNFSCGIISLQNEELPIAFFWYRFDVSEFSVIFYLKVFLFCLDSERIYSLSRHTKLWVDGFLSLF